MTRQIAMNDEAYVNPRFADAFVIFSVTLLSLAFGAWFLLQLGLTLWAGMVSALAVYSALLSVHLVMRRSFIATDGDDIRAVAAESSSVHWTRATDKREKALPEARPKDSFSFRPSREPTMAPSTPAVVAAPPAAPSTDATARAASESQEAPDAAQPEMSVELIQDLIKKLADELNGTPAAPAPAKPEPANATEALIGRSVAALQTTARAMAEPTASPPAAPPPAAPLLEPEAAGPASRTWWSSLQPNPGNGDDGGPRIAPPPTLNPHVARIAEAVAAERMEVLLEPIHALAEGRPRHFEVSVRLLTADGATLEQSEFQRAAKGSGLMPQIDAARMIRAARVARRLGERGRQGSVLTAVTGEALTDEVFLDVAAVQPGTEGQMGLVLSFAQSEVRTFTPGHAEVLGTLAAGGFSFALEEVTDLDMDFGGLKAMGFQFVKLDAPVFLDGLPAPGGRVPAADICRYLSDFGLTLIVGRIEDDWLLARVLGFGVLFGKGALFGGPRLVKEEIVSGASAA
jgi:cyclic-di-GMP phosphodiesterase, flagellum assembly factor TipF